MTKSVSGSHSIPAAPESPRKSADTSSKPATARQSGSTHLILPVVEDPKLSRSVLLDPERIDNYPVVVIGVGAIGSQLAEMLAKLGVMKLTLVDCNEVNESAFATQEFCEEGLGCPSVQAVAKRLLAINHRIQVDAHSWVSKEDLIPSCAAVFSCVESLQTRRDIFRHFQDEDWTVLFNGRLTDESFQVYCVDRTPEAIKVYRASLHSAGEPCLGNRAAQLPVYIAAIAAAILCAQFKRWAMGQNPELLIQFDLFGMDCFQ
jgi:hypothetical protein